MKFKEGLTEKNVVVKCGADTFMPFALTFGFYIIFFGAVSPGGGFQGGVLVASAVLMIYLGYGYKTVTNSINAESLRVNEACATTIYIILALIGVFAGVAFCDNVFWQYFNVGDPLSGGTISYMSYAVGYNVLTGIGFLLITMLGMLMDSNGEGK